MNLLGRLFVVVKQPQTHSNTSEPSCSFSMRCLVICLLLYSILRRHLALIVAFIRALLSILPCLKSLSLSVILELIAVALVLPSPVLPRRIIWSDTLLLRKELLTMFPLSTEICVSIVSELLSSLECPVSATIPHHFKPLFFRISIFFSSGILEQM